MNKLNKIFLFVIIILTILLTISTYYAVYYRNGYFTAAKEMENLLKKVGGVTTIVEDDGTERTVVGNSITDSEK